MYTSNIHWHSTVLFLFYSDFMFYVLILQFVSNILLGICNLIQNIRQWHLFGCKFIVSMWNMFWDCFSTTLVVRHFLLFFPQIKNCAWDENVHIHLLKFCSINRTVMAKVRINFTTSVLVKQYQNMFHIITMNLHNVYKQMSISDLSDQLLNDQKI